MASKKNERSSIKCSSICGGIKMENNITLQSILDSANATQFTQYGIREATHYSHFKLSDSKFVVKCLEVIESANKNQIFVYAS